MNETLLKDLVFIGGGHSHAIAIKMLAMNPLPYVQMTLISRDIISPYSGMLPGYVAGHYTKDECYIDLNKICQVGKVRVIHASVTGLDLTKKLIYCNDGRPPLRYDILSIDVGSSPKPLQNNLSHNSVITPVKPIDHFGDRWEEILDRLNEMSHQDDIYDEFRIDVVGGGAGGTELAFAIDYRIKRDFPNLKYKISLLTKGSTLVSSHGKHVQDILNRILREKSIEVFCDTEIIDSSSEYSSSANRHINYLIASDGRRFEFNEAIWCTQAKGQEWLTDCGLETTVDGFVCVDKYLESVNTKGVFAAGDIAQFVENPRPKAGVFAVRAGPPLARNLRNKILKKSLEEWVPQDEFLGIIGTGDPYAIASKGGYGIEGPEMWKLKEKIDTTWMTNLHELPDMETMMANKQKDSENIFPIDDISKDNYEMIFRPKMRCGGCGSKIGSNILSKALKIVQQQYNVKRDEVVNSNGDDAALVRPPIPSTTIPDPLLVHTIDYIKSCHSDPFIFGKIVATHALSDVFAMNGSPVTALALCTMPLAAEDITTNCLTQILSGISCVLMEENCSLVGGHTSEGRDFSVGLSVTGVVSESNVLRKGPPRDGDVLILTKGLGTGILGAANMRACAKGQWMSDAVSCMLQSNRQAARIFSKYKCSACTDITGFGLIGHLIEMLECSNDISELTGGMKLSATISLSELPVLDGALECSNAGIQSSLYPQNVRISSALNLAQSESSPLYPLLFDPQTSGGLLASVDARNTESIIEELRMVGYKQSRIIGKVSKQSTDTMISLTN